MERSSSSIDSTLPHEELVLLIGSPLFGRRSMVRRTAIQPSSTLPAVRKVSRIPHVNNWLNAFLLSTHFPAFEVP